MYKIKLTNEQIQTIYEITGNKDKQSKLMSVLSYLIKYTKDNKLTKTLNRLYTMYIRLEYRKITRSYFYKLVDLLKEYKLFAIAEDKIKDKIEDKEEVAELIENTNFESDFEKHNNLTSNKNTYIYTSNISDDVIEVAEEILKDMNVKSKVIKKMVLDKLENINLDPQGMLNYIYAVVLDKIKIYYKARDKYKQKVIETRNSYSFAAPNKENKRGFNNFEAREMYTNEQAMHDLEYRLLGWH